MSAAGVAEQQLYGALAGIPAVDIPRNVASALTKRWMPSVLREIVALRRGPGRLTPQEYFYYGLWRPEVAAAEKRRFVGKQAQHAMHCACNDRSWFAPAADKVLFHALMRGEGFPVPELLAVTQPTRRLAGVPTLTCPTDIAGLLREPDHYPLFAKPVGGKYSLSVLSADGFDPGPDEVILLGGERRKADEVATDLTGAGGYLIQRRLAPHPQLASLFGPRLWSVRVLVLLGPDGPTIHRAIAKITTGVNPADNFWRTGNMLGALDCASGRNTRTVRGTAADLTVDDPHPDTGRPIAGTEIPNWPALTEMVSAAASVLPGIRTQSWDVAVTDRGPVLLEVNWGGDLNLAQLAHGAGVLDSSYGDHLRWCGYKL